MSTITSVYSLIKAYYNAHPHGHYFDDKTLKFFGERISEMRLLKGTVEITDICGNQHTCYILSKYSRKHPLGARRTYAYFDIKTLENVITD